MGVVIALLVFLGAMLSVWPGPTDHQRLVENMVRMGGNRLHFMYPLSNDAGPAPLVFFIPGWRASLEGYLPHLREFAQEGYAVIAVDWSDAVKGSQGALDLSSRAAFEDTLRRADAAARQQATEISAILDELSPDSFPGITLKLDKVGIYGHSFGGAVAVQAAVFSPRFGASANMDGWLFAEAVEALIPSPTLLITDSAAMPSRLELESASAPRRFEAFLNARNARWAYHQRANSDFELVEIPGAGHGSFIVEEAGFRIVVQSMRRIFSRTHDARTITLSRLTSFFHRHLAS